MLPKAVSTARLSAGTMPVIFRISMILSPFFSCCIVFAGLCVAVVLRDPGHDAAHLAVVFLHALQQAVLGVGAYEVVVGVFYLVIGVAVDIVCQETYGLHIRKQGNSIGQIVDFDVGEKRFSSF